ncbi:MAG: coenzyme F420-0:L-glutamate ligase [Candidatus Nezhaarchaeales archaeon]
MSVKVEIYGIKVNGEVKEGEDLARLIVEEAERQANGLLDGDVVVVTSKIVAKAEGRLVNLKRVRPSAFAKNLARYTGKPATLIEVILRESRSITRVRRGTIIVETKHGFICANAGVDRSNVKPGFLTLLPKDPDRSAQMLKSRIKELTGRDVAVIISDTQGRPFREGQVDASIGLAGLEPINDLRGLEDLYGYRLRVKRIAIADELAAAAELVIGQASEGIPIAVIRGVKYRSSEKATVKRLLRPKRRSLFL